MITRIEALRYRALRYVAQDLQSFQVLVGANASGKSTFLDVVAFLGDLLVAGPAGAVLGDARLGVAQRAPDPRHLLWMREGDRFDLAVELAIPADRRSLLPNGGFDRCRYEVALGLHRASGEIALLAETLWLKSSEGVGRRSQAQRVLFPAAPEPPVALVQPGGRRTPAGWKKVVNKVEDSGNDYFFSETSGWMNPFRLGPTKSALANLPLDESRFPVASWVRQFLVDGVKRIVLASEAMRRPSPPGRSKAYLPDGSNLPWVVHELERLHPERCAAWVGHLREALPDLAGIETREFEADRSRYLVLRYENGLEAPSWLVSDGTLRLMALTLLGFLPEVPGVFLIEEPENGVHPRAVEIVVQALSSVYSAQVLCATHSPVVVSATKLSQVLCFARDESGATDIAAGPDHPRLRSWKGEVDIGTLFASGVLG